MQAHQDTSCRLPRNCLLLFAALASSAVLLGQDRAADPLLQADRQIEAQIREHHELMKNLEYLSDMLGPRLTGSKNLRQANQWMEQKFREYGLANVHQEAWTLGRSWTRGTAAARILSPAEHRITLASYGWAVGTHGKIHGPVIYLNAHKPEELEPYRGKLKDAIVILFPPQELSDPQSAQATSYQTEFLPMNTGKPTRSFAFFRQIYSFLTQEGAGVMLMAADKKYGLLDMFAIGWLAAPGLDATAATGEQWGIAPVPAAYVAWEDYNLIWRLLQRGPVEMEVDIQNSFSDQPVEAYNTVAEIPGAEKPDEVVMLGAHLDSWDLGTGATDNGTGSAAVLEAARALAKTGLRPKRTIRFVLFSGEEEFLLGSKAYVKAHHDELPKISGLLIHDLGTGRVSSLALNGNYAAREVMDHVVEPMRDLGLLELSLRTLFASDDETFAEAGVPGFLAISENLDYNLTHHSHVDTFDRVRADDLAQGAQVLAAWAYNVAELPDLLPRKH